MKFEILYYDFFSVVFFVYDVKNQMWKLFHDGYEKDDILFD